jgi:hypothetical protein
LRTVLSSFDNERRPGDDRDDIRLYGHVTPPYEWRRDRGG